MRVIPVLDLKGGVAVHAVRGERSAYAPVRSALAGSADPLVLARAFRTRLGLDACYVADLDAIAGAGHHGPTIRAIAGLGVAVWLDAGVATAADAERAVGHGAARVIVGTETLRDLPAWRPS
jgi:phosphoribosylformimino-5-aminoimidazole carboxamide ribotide isomerase